jgi:putative Mn2+ efflux pump MntP
MDAYIAPVIIGIGLAMDCFAVSLAAGCSQRTSRLKIALILGSFFGIFQMGMTLGGWLLGSGFAGIISSYDHWVAGILLFVIGGKMFIEGIRDGQEVPRDIMQIIPITILAIATSIDALAVGISFAFLEVPPVIPAVIIGIIATAFSFAGVFTGGKIGCFFGNRVDILGGVILILIGIRVITSGSV